VPEWSWKNYHYAIIFLYIIIVTYCDNFYCIFVTLSRIKTFLFFHALLFLNCRFWKRRQWPIGFRKVCLLISCVLCASLRRIITIARVLEAKIDERGGEWGSELSCGKKRDKADRSPSTMAAIVMVVVVHRVFRRRVPAIFLALFNNRALHRDMLRSYRAILPQRLSSAIASYSFMSTKLSWSAESEEI